MRSTGSLVLVITACAGRLPDGVAGDDDAPGIDAAGSDAGDPAVVPAFCAAYPPPDLAAVRQSTRVFYGDDGRLRYAADAQGNRITDFGHAGYHEGARELPDVPGVATVEPGSGDDTARIQAALDEVAGRAPDASGHRGAVVLAPGVYEIAGTLRVRASGVVLRGAGDGDDPGTDTILRALGDSPHQRAVIVLGGGGSVRWLDVPGTTVAITTARVAVGDRTFEVDHPERLEVGDRVIVLHPSTAAWIDALAGGGAQTAWTPGDVDIPYLRRVVAKDGATLTIDIPVHAHLERRLAQATVYKVDDRMLVREAGVESLRIDIVTAGGDDENHAWNAIEISGAEDAWVKDVTALHFGYAGVRVYDADRITVRDVRALDPVAQVTGGRMYNFAADGFAQQVLFVDVEASLARHAFVSNGTSSVSGIVFLRGRGRRNRNTSEGHRRWSQALLYDNIVETEPSVDRIVGLYNRGDWGTQHGWAAVHSVLWRYDTGGKTAVVQRPPTAQNWAIGTIGRVSGDGPFAGSAGFAEAVDGTLAPASLYEAQLCERLRAER